MVGFAPLPCLAMTIYGEARGEPVEGQFAVAQVVINRTEHPQYPKDVCSVVLQKNQFSPVRGIGDIEEPGAFALALLIAGESLQNRHTDPMSGATHFFSGSKVPHWALNMVTVSRIGDHIFMSDRVLN